MKSKMFVLSILLYLGIAQIIICQGNSLHGIWKITKTITYVSGKEYVNSNPLPSIIIFTKNHYSFVQMFGAEPQNNYEKRWHPTDEEKVTSYNSIIVNAGTYSIENNLIITKPQIAKTPDFVNGYAIFNYHFKNDTLWLTPEEYISNDGILDSAAVKYKTALFLHKLE